MCLHHVPSWVARSSALSISSCIRRSRCGLHLQGSDVLLAGANLLVSSWTRCFASANLCLFNCQLDALEDDAVSPSETQTTLPCRSINLGEDPDSSNWYSGLLVLCSPPPLCCLGLFLFNLLLLFWCLCLFCSLHPCWHVYWCVWPACSNK